MKTYSNDTLSLDDLLADLKRHIGQADIILKVLAQRSALANGRELVRSYANVWNLLAPFNYHPNLLKITKIAPIEHESLSTKLIGIYISLDPPDNQHEGQIPLTKELAEDIANQLLTKVGEIRSRDQLSFVCNSGHHNLCPIREFCVCSCHKDDVKGMVPR
jgi:hypothetical protein